jgi:uncharacterized protein YjdB
MKSNKTKTISTVIMIILACMACKQELISQPSSRLVFEGPDGKLVYTPFANRGQTNEVNVIPDFSWAGYKFSQEPIPDVPVVATLEPIEGDNRAHIQQAINEVAQLPIQSNGFRGAILLKPGLYEVSGPLYMREDGVVLKGSGQQPANQNGTELYATGDYKYRVINVQGSAMPAPTEPLTLINAKFTDETIIIDGAANEKAWEITEKQVVDKVHEVMAGQTATNTAEFRALWNKEFLYFFFKVYDDSPSPVTANDNGVLWRKDGLELWFDGQNRHVHVGANFRSLEGNFQLRKNYKWNMTGWFGQEMQGNGANFINNGMQWAEVPFFNSSNQQIGYIVELAIPWISIHLQNQGVVDAISFGDRMSLDVSLVDEDPAISKNARKSVVIWGGGPQGKSHPFFGSTFWGDLALTAVNDTTLLQFSVNELDVKGLEGLAVNDPVAEDGAILRTTEILGFNGIHIKSNNPNATVSVTVNGEVVGQEYLPGISLNNGDQIIATVVAEDGVTIGYYKVVIMEATAMKIKSARTHITSDIPSGKNTFQVADASEFAVGDLITVLRTPNQAWIDVLQMGQWGWTPQSYRIPYERTITAKQGNTITVDIPMVQAIENQYGGGEIFHINTSSRVRNVGIENMLISSYYAHETDEEHALYAVEFNIAEDCWVRNVTALHIGKGLVNIVKGYKITVEESAMVDPKSPIQGGRRYSFNIEDGSFNLIQRCYARNGRHDYAMGSRVPGPNVFVDNIAEQTHSDIGPHHRYATGTLFDNIKGGEMRVRNRAGSGTGHGWAGAQTMFWNVHVTGNHDIWVSSPTAGMNWGIGSVAPVRTGDGFFESNDEHVLPRSLFFAQLEDRVGKAVVMAITTETQRNGRIYDALEEWKGIGILQADMPAIISKISVSSENNRLALVLGQSMKMTATIQPENLADIGVSWHVESKGGAATMTADGMLTATATGLITVVAAANDESGVRGSLDITIVDEEILTNEIIVTAQGNQTNVAKNETLQLTATILPELATDKRILWSVIQETGNATISDSGLMTAVDEGTVNIVASALDGSNVSGSIPITIIGDPILVIGMMVRGESGATELVNGETLQMQVFFVPENATNKQVEWLVTPGTGSATISDSGLLTATIPGTVVVTANTLDGSGVSASVTLTVIPIMVTFKVNMIAAQNFDPQKHKVYITGSMFDWSIPGLRENDQLMVATDDDWIYTTTMELEKNTYQYKYAINPGNNGFEWQGLPYREVEVAGMMNVINVFGDLDDKDPTGIVVADKNGLTIYPIPAKQTLYISSEIEIQEVLLYNTNGQLIYKQGVDDYQYQLDTSSLRGGMYMLKLFTRDNLMTRKILISD